MDMTSRIAFERAWAKANRLPQEERAIAPTGQVAYAHGVAAGEAKNREEAFVADMEFREEAAAEKDRQFGISGAERERQVLTDLESRYTQAVQELNERERQFGGRLSWTGERAGKTLEEQERQFGGRLTASGGQFDRRIGAESDIFEKRLAASTYESGKLFNQKMTQFEQDLAFRAKSFDDEMAWGRKKFDRTLSFRDRVFLDKMANERRDLDTWIRNSRIGAVIQLANTAVSAYGMKKGIDQRKELTAELKSMNAKTDTQNFNRSYDAAVEGMIAAGNNAYKTPKYGYDPDWQMSGKYLIDSDPSGVTYPLTLSDFAKSYDRMKVTPRTYEFLSP